MTKQEARIPVMLKDVDTKAKEPGYGMRLIGCGLDRILFANEHARNLEDYIADRWTSPDVGLVIEFIRDVDFPKLWRLGNCWNGGKPIDKLEGLAVYLIQKVATMPKRKLDAELAKGELKVINRRLEGHKRGIKHHTEQHAKLLKEQTALTRIVERAK